MSLDKQGRPVRVTSISFKDRSLKEISDIVESEGKKGADIIVLPELWRGGESEPETLDGITVTTIAKLAHKHGTYIVCPIYRKDDRSQRINSAVLLDRHGKIACVYDKVFPYWGEFDLTPPCEVGIEVPVYKADFGCIGIATCFDANFPEVWKRLADQGAELVIWPSAYSAGTTLQAHALNNHFYIVSSTWKGDCIVYDITGKELLYEKSDGVNVSRMTLDLDRGLYHENFNLEKRDRMLEDYKGSLEQELHMEREEWFVLRAVRPGISAREKAGEYGMEELRDYQNRSRNEIDRMRGWTFANKNI